MVFNTENSLSDIDKWFKRVAFTILEALFVHRKVEMIYKMLDLFKIILQTYSKSKIMCCVSKGYVKSQLIIVAESKAGTVAIAINIIRVDAIAAFFSSLLHASPHDGNQNIQFAHIEPSLTLPAVKIPAEKRGWKGVAIRTPVFIAACTEITDDMLAL